MQLSAWLFCAWLVGAWWFSAWLFSALLLVYDASVTIYSYRHVPLECDVKHTRSIFVHCPIGQTLKCDIHFHTPQVCNVQLHFLPSQLVRVLRTVLVSSYWSDLQSQQLYHRLHSVSDNEQIIARQSPKHVVFLHLGRRHVEC